MVELNRSAAEVMSSFDISACTDITGFGLLGHLAEMVAGSGLSARVFFKQVPLIPDALAFADMGFLPTAAYNNMKFRDSMICFSKSLQRCWKDILLDPQTSGGLLIAVKKEQLDDLLNCLQDSGVNHAACIGEIINESDEKIHVN